MRMQSSLGAAVVCALQLWIPTPTSAHAATSFEELAASNVLQPGERIEVRDAAGNTLKGEFQEFRAGTLVLFSASGFERAFPATDVGRIRRAGGMRSPGERLLEQVSPRSPPKKQGLQHIRIVVRPGMEARLAL